MFHSFHKDVVYTERRTYGQFCDLETSRTHPYDYYVTESSQGGGQYEVRRKLSDEAIQEEIKQENGFGPDDDDDDDYEKNKYRELKTTESMANSVAFGVFMVAVLTYSCLYFIFWAPSEFSS